MARKKTTFNINGDTMVFNKQALREAVELYSTKNKCTKESVFEQLDELLDDSYDTIKSWYKISGSGPSYIDSVQRLAEFFSLDIKLLLKKEEEKTMVYTDRQIESIKRVYDPIVMLMEDYKNTCGISPDCKGETMLDGYTLVSGFDFDDATDARHIMERVYRIRMQLKQERIYLHALDIYDILYSFVNEDLYNVISKALDGEEEADQLFVEMTNKLDEIVTSIN